MNTVLVGDLSTGLGRYIVCGKHYLCESLYILCTNSYVFSQKNADSRTAGGGVT